jgi:hypothetical protein
MPGTKNLTPLFGRFAEREFYSLLRYGIRNASPNNSFDRSCRLRASHQTGSELYRQVGVNSDVRHRRTDAERDSNGQLNTSRSHLYVAACAGLGIS